MGKNCALGLENVFKTEGTVFPYPDRARPVNNVFIFSPQKRNFQFIKKTGRLSAV